MKNLYFALAEREYTLEGTTETLLAQLNDLSDTLRYYKGSDEEFDRIYEIEQSVAEELAAARTTLDDTSRAIRKMRREVGRETFGEWQREFEADARFPKREQQPITLMPHTPIEDSPRYQRLTDIYSN